MYAWHWQAIYWVTPLPVRRYHGDSGAWLPTSKQLKLYTCSLVFAAATAAAAAMTVQQHEDRRRMVWWLQPEHLLTLQLRDINITKRQKPVTQWPRFFGPLSDIPPYRLGASVSWCWTAGHEKRRGEQLKWSLAFRLYIGSFPCAQLPEPVHTARLGRVFFVYLA